MGGLSAWHYLVVAIVAAFLFFGWKQLPDMARSFGRSLRVFKTEIKGMTGDDAARDAERDGGSTGSSAASGPKQLAPRPTPVAQQPVARETPRAEVVRNASAPTASAASSQAASAPAASSRPRPTPNGPAR